MNRLKLLLLALFGWQLSGSFLQWKHPKHKFDQSSNECSKKTESQSQIVQIVFLSCPSSEASWVKYFIKLFQLRIHNSELLPRNRGRSPPRAGARGRDGQAAKHLPTPGGHDFALSQGMTSETVLGLRNLNLHLGKFNMEPKNHLSEKEKMNQTSIFSKCGIFQGLNLHGHLESWIFWWCFFPPRGGEVN